MCTAISAASGPHLQRFNRGEIHEPHRTFFSLTAIALASSLAASNTTKDPEEATIKRHEIDPGVDGVLREGGTFDGYYKTSTTSFGLRIGAQSKAVIMMFMTQDALDKFRTSDKCWTAGAVAFVAPCTSRFTSRFTSRRHVGSASSRF